MIVWAAVAPPITLWVTVTLPLTTQGNVMVPFPSGTKRRSSLAGAAENRAKNPSVVARRLSAIAVTCAWLGPASPPPPAFVLG